MGRVAYGLAFVVVLPLVLAAWASGLEGRTNLPVVHAPVAGSILLALGLAVMLRGMWDLKSRGGGMPMNAYPTRLLVESGAYRLLPHPIYTGFVLATAAASLIAGSAAGLWIVTPVLAAGCVALVFGYERDATCERLGRSPRCVISLPPADDAAPTRKERLGALAAVLAPWLTAYEAVGRLPVSGAVSMQLPGEAEWPVLAWTEPLYASVYLAAMAAPWFCRTRRELRDWAVVGAIGTCIGILCYLVLPCESPPRGAVPDGFWGALLDLERSEGFAGRASFPSFHVFWACASAAVVGRRGGAVRFAAWVWCAAAAASCSTTGMHALLDLPAGVGLWLAAIGTPRAARAAVRASERLANGWIEWRLGPVRVINHGVFAGAAAAAGIVIAGAVAGDPALPWLAMTAVGALVAAALWGQCWVKAPTSLRPFGYFGALLGAAAVLVLAGVSGASGWSAAAGLAVAAPWVQAVGRLRCLVQGCCHGAPTEGWWAIRYRHPMSRVCRASGMHGVPVHPTPLYSIAGNLVIGALLARLWWAGGSPSLLVGGYLIMAGLLRFVEEHLRGEPHTPRVGGLRIYQWFAALSVGAGMAVTCLSTEPVHPSAVPTFWSLAGWGAMVGGVWMLGMGVDLPGVNRRFARLT